VKVEVQVEKLLEMAKKASDQAEVYSLQEIADGISFENAKLKDIESKVQSGVSLRIMKEGRLGFAYTKNLLNRAGLLQNAIDSLKGGVSATFDFPLTKEPPSVHSYDSSIENLSNSHMVEEFKRIADLLTSKTKGQVNLSGGRGLIQRRLINNQGTDLSSTSSIYSLSTELLYPGSYSAIHRQFVSKRFEEAPDSYVNFILDLYNQSTREITPKGGKMKVLFLPETLYVLIWRLQSATNGKNIYHTVSPCLDKMGERLLDEKLTVYDDPLNDRLPDARSFDDEGTPCRLLSIVEQGRLISFYYDLFYAQRLNVAPTGHGYKSSMWGGETISFKPFPSLEHLYILPGNQSFSELVKQIDQGVIVAGAMGAHSGNILNGDFSIGLSPGLYVEQGEVMGYVKDAMIAGNIFDTMKNIIAIENTLYPSYSGTFPAILFENVSVATMT
jgi:PmbA protein